MKSFKELSFRDSFMFGKITEDAEICRDVLSSLMGYDVGKVVACEREKHMHALESGKYVRLDIWAEDEKKRLYDVEMQNGNPRRELPLRSRYYQSMIDMTRLDGGVSYGEMQDTYIIFICTFDPFGRGRYRYTFQERCIEEPDLVLDDRATRIFFNTTANMSEAPECTRALLRYIEAREVTNDVTERIDEAVEDAKNREKWKGDDMFAFYATMMDEREDGRKEGRAEARSETVKKLLKKMPEEEVAGLLEISVDEVKKLAMVEEKQR